MRTKPGGDRPAVRRHMRPLQRWASGPLPQSARDFAVADDLIQDALLQTVQDDPVAKHLSGWISKLESVSN